jgi:NADPH-dependent 2,4-dienoyl-CoA reductase/sulfur reductase-like enzyme
MEAFEYVVVGGGLAGGRACDGVRRIDEAGRIALVAGESHAPYERPPLSKGYLVGRQGLDKVLLQPDDYYADLGVTLLSGVRATDLDPGAHAVGLEDGRELGYGKLCLATGSVARSLPLPGAGLQGVHTLRTIEDSDAIRQAATAGERALVVGGSFIGSEVAASLAQMGVSVTMVFPEPRLLMRIAPPELSAHIEAAYHERGVSILAENRPAAFVGVEKAEAASLDDGTEIGVDLVVLGVGVALDTDLAQTAGLAVGPRGEVLVDEFLSTSARDVYAAGDIAAWPDPTFGEQLRVEHWDVARRQGIRAGRAMAGDVKPYVALPYFFSDLFDLSIEVWGHLDSWDQTVLRGSLASGSFAFYYFDQGTLVGVLAADCPGAERKPMQALVKRRARLEDIAEQIADEHAVLSEV